MEQGTWMAVAGGLGILALLVAAVRMVLLVRFHFNAEALAVTLEKLVLNTNIERARRLCQAMDVGGVGAGLLAVIDAHQEGERDRDALRGAFGEQTTGPTRALRALVRLDAVAIGLVVLAVLAILVGGSAGSLGLWVAPALAVLTVFQARARAERILRGHDLVVDRLIGVLEQAPRG